MAIYEENGGNTFLWLFKRDGHRYRFYCMSTPSARPETRAILLIFIFKEVNWWPNNTFR